MATDDTPQQRTLQLSDQEILDYITDRSARAATAVAKERLNLLLGMIAVLIALIGGSAGFWINSVLDKRVSAATEQLTTSLTEEIADETEAAQKALALQVEDQVKFAIDLSLISAELASFQSFGGYSDDKAEVIIDALERSLAPLMTSFEGSTRNLLERRIEDTLDQFISPGDYTRVFRVYDIFGDDLTLTPGIYASLTTSLMSTAVVLPDAIDRNQDLVDRLLRQKLNPLSNEYEHQRALALMLYPGPEKWSVDDLQARIETEDGRYRGFSAYLTDFADSLTKETAPDGLNHSLGAVERLRLLREAAEAAADKLQ